MGKRSRVGFTILELLVVLAIIALLFALLAPALNNHGREPSRRAMCRNNLRQLGLAMHNYHDAHKFFPPGIVAEAYLSPNNCSYTAAENAGKHYSSASAFTLLLPYMEERALYNGYNHKLGCATVANSTAAEGVVKTLLCPSNPSDMTIIEPGYYPGYAGRTDYVLSAGASALLTCVSPSGTGEGSCGGMTKPRPSAGAFHVNSSTSLKQIRDGSSFTFLAGEGASGVPHGLPEFGSAEPTSRNGKALVEQAWSQGYLGTTGGRGGYGSVFAATAFDATYDEHGALIEPLTALSMKTGQTKMLRGTTYRASLSTEAAVSNNRRPDLFSLGISISPFRSSHENVCHFLFADGSVRALRLDIGPRVYAGLSTVAGGEEIDNEGL